MSETLPYNSIGEMFVKQVEKFPKKPALMYKEGGKYKPITYEEYFTLSLKVARGLKKRGVVKGDRVSILAENSHNWVITDMACQLLGAVSVPIYATNTPEQIEFILNNCEAKGIAVSTLQQYNKLLEIKDKLKHIEFVFSFEVFEGNKDLPVLNISQFGEYSSDISEKEKEEILKATKDVKLEDLATIIYTSGTTGIPKGVMLTHSNLLWDAYLGIKKAGFVKENDVFLSFLPLSHSLERTAGYYIAIMSGVTIAYAESIEKVPENVKEVRPTAMVSVPRLFEKVYHRVFEDVHNMSYFKKNLFHKAINVGRRYVYKKYIEKKSPGFDGILWKIYNKLVFNKIKESLGGRIRFFISGGAPLGVEVNEFFWSIGLPIFEGYGLTETSPAICLNTIDKIKFGSVGTLFEMTEAKLEDDGELLVKGPMIMKGYYKAPEETKKVLKDGWLSTGDIAKIDEEGFIFIVDRKKELIVTAGGKNIAPQPIENLLKLDKYISQAYIYGDRKPYLVGLVVPNFERLIEWAKENKINFFDMEDLVHNSKVIKLYGERIKLVNDKLPRYETLKKFRVLCKPFSIETGELTPTLKIKRRVIYKKYKDFIECLYYECEDDKYVGIVPFDKKENKKN